ncbi:MAG: heavy metal-responsive transcriptional regulator [Stackebrandtia sp.]
MNSTTVAREQSMTVAQLARRAGVSPDTVRYYERAGLLPPPPRSSGGYRRYDESAADRLLFIRGAQRLGLRLREIADLLSVRDTGVCPCEPAELLLTRRVDEIDAEMARLSALRSQLTNMLDSMSGTGCPDPEPGRWCPPECDKGGECDDCCDADASDRGMLRRMPA